MAKMKKTRNEEVKSQGSKEVRKFGQRPINSLYPYILTSLYPYILIFSVAIITACLLAGCAKKQKFEPKPICLANTDIKSAMLETEKALIRMNFVIDKVDADSGIVRTKPLAGGQFFEIWRQDNRGSYNRNLANLHSIQRTVELKFSQKYGQMCIDCNVKVERLSIPEKEIDSSARAYSMFSSSSEVSQALKLNAEQQAKMDWVDLGRDNSFEAYILEKVNKRLNSTKGKK